MATPNIPDNRIRFPSAKIDLETQVGETGQSHDSYPTPGSQARADWMNLVVIGLLSQQSSFREPTQYRDGTPWFDLNTMTLKIRANEEWKLISEVISLAEDSDGNSTTLNDWFLSVADSLSSLAQEIVYSGSSTVGPTALITIPESLRNLLYSDSRAFVYKNGILIDPRNTRLEPSALPTAVKITNDSIDNGDNFTVFIRRVPADSFYSPSVTIP